MWSPSSSGVSHVVLRHLSHPFSVAEENGVVGALGELNDDLLPLLPTAVSVAPLAIPLLGAAVAVPAPAFFGLSLASLGGGESLLSKTSFLDTNAQLTPSPLSRTTRSSAWLFRPSSPFRLRLSSPSSSPDSESPPASSTPKFLL